MSIILSVLMGLVLMFFIGNSKSWQKNTANMSAQRHNIYSVAIIILMSALIYVLSNII